MASGPVPSSRPDGIVLPAHTVVMFDPAQVFAERIGDRKVIYLEQNIWIHLRDGKTDAAKRGMDACLRAVTKQRAVFPVSYAAVSELLEIPSTELRVKQADVMDPLCRGLTFRNVALIHDLEGGDVFRHLFFETAPPDRRREAFTMLPDYVGDGRLTFREGVSAAFAHDLVSRLRSEHPAFQLRWMVDHVDHAQVLRNHAAAETYGGRIDAQRAAYRKHLGLDRIDRDVLAHEERAGLYKSVVVPALPRLGLSRMELHRVQERMQKVAANSRRMLRRSFRAAAPAMETLAQVFSRQAQDPERKTDSNDFWDAEHASVFAYADAFATADHGLQEVLPVGDRRPPRARAVLLPSVDELATWLDGLA